jgi:hypothetical protein
MMVKILGILMIFLIGCGGGMWKYRMGDSGGHISVVREIPIYVDEDFTGEELQSLMMAVNEWNGVFNGRVKLRIKEQFSGREGFLREAERVTRTGSGWIILRLNTSEEAERVGIEAGALAVSNEIGGHLMMVVGDRIGNRDMRIIFMHEMGHLLGSGHFGKWSLMTEYHEHGYDCIDKRVVAEVAAHFNLNLKNLNYCVTPEFE